MNIGFVFGSTDLCSTYFAWFALDEAARLEEKKQIRVVVFGGDGTVVWVMNALTMVRTFACIALLCMQPHLHL